METKKIPSINEIRKQSPLKTKYDPFAYLPDYLAPYFVKLIMYTPVTANQISLVSYLLYILAAFFLAINRYVVPTLIILHIVVLMDCIDGALARAKEQTSFLGLYFEYVSHETGPIILLFALGLYLYNILVNPIYLYLSGLIVVALLVINSFGTAKQRIMYQNIIKTKRLPEKLISSESTLKDTKNYYLVAIYNILHATSNIAFSIWIITIGYIFGFLEYIFFFYFIYFWVIAVFKVIRELSVGFKMYGLR